MKPFQLVIGLLAAGLAPALVSPACAQNATRTRLVTSPNPSTVGFTVDMKATVDGYQGGAPPTGSVTFSDGTTPLGAAPLTTVGAGQDMIDGYFHTCAITSGGGVKCWGNANGLGDGSTVSRPTPGPVPGLSGVTAVATGVSHSCALTAAGGVKCWGFNGWGEVGDGTNIARLTPVDVTGLSSGVVAITAGERHSCALTQSGGVKCWGFNADGRLGDGGTTDKYTPENVLGLTSEVVAIAAGGQHTCALTSAGGAKCWGTNFNGQLGDGTTTNRPGPVTVSGLGAGVVAIAAGLQHSCAITTAGRLKCWGANFNGQLGNRTTEPFRATPVDAIGLTSIAAVTLGTSHSCALTSAGAVKCFGQNDTGQLGTGTATPSLTPVSPIGLTSGVIAIGAGYGHNCALRGNGALRCWGYDIAGQVGDGQMAQNVFSPVSVPFTGVLRSQARLTQVFPTPGTRTMTATYPGDAQHAPSSGTMRHTAQ